MNIDKLKYKRQKLSIFSCLHQINNFKCHSSAKFCVKLAYAFLECIKISLNKNNYGEYYNLSRNDINAIVNEQNLWLDKFCKIDMSVYVYVTELVFIFLQTILQYICILIVQIKTRLFYLSLQQEKENHQLTLVLLLSQLLCVI